ncbi:MULTISPECIES: peptidylprolyl isomerase [unclassified Acinetobacter]|uniref:FKBP-type peptidyl-prolyl cis-trans isomerase n=1 Tax=unclassified Acinetobacter TaxID=196816 RepID=UPI00293467A0|nr:MULTISPECIES: FKBP-type peptidyl-prolyl cis-trans isomerase [unclassified Acinetobacter]WOE30821.1 FKBP-type peptidyl-prolyl cis-trans isomerase [Acinetobacter sp. SAAs470]WOE39016.1 FKBP-type peptidyl-prolyl cis-trans isomerase [Acinetobacter sp. SAAs474]
MTDFINPNETTRIAEGSQVDLHFSVAIENGAEIDNTRTRTEPVRLVIGDGNLLPGFEKALLGLCAGDRRTVSLMPEDAFGPWNPENVQKFDTVKFEQPPIVGHMIEFEDKAKSSLYGVVKTVNDDITEIDFNHPLAGKNITFEVEIFKVTPAGQQGIKIM